jgi:hypothetical protein
MLLDEVIKNKDDEDELIKDKAGLREVWPFDLEDRRWVGTRSRKASKCRDILRWPIGSDEIMSPSDSTLIYCKEAVGEVWQEKLKITGSD